MKYIDMSKKIFLIMILLCLVLQFVLTGCGNNSISFSFGISQNYQDNSLLKPNQLTQVQQNKESIENSKLVFKTNEQGDFDNMYICFEGNNINSVVMSGENKTILYDNYDTVSRRLDIFNFFYDVGDLRVYDGYNVIYDSVDPQADFETRWNNGDFDEIKNVYLNGLSVYDINKMHRNHDKDIGTVVVEYLGKDEIKDAKQLFYIDEKRQLKEPVINISIVLSSANKRIMPNEEDEILVQGKTVETNKNISEDYFIYRFEKLFYESQQTALETCGLFTYSDLQGEIIGVTVNYNDGSTEQYTIDISFDEYGNLIAVLGD